jgi:MinD-like ATPase involved in chromosome partitioning or flagellar assembly
MSAYPGDGTMRRIQDKYRNAPAGLVDRTPQAPPGIADVPAPREIPGRTPIPVPAPTQSAAPGQWTPTPHHLQHVGAQWTPSPRHMECAGAQRSTSATAEAARSERTGGRTEGAQLGWRATMNRVFKTHLSKGSDEIEYDRRVSQIQRTLRVSKKVGVLSGKGSAGKTSIVLNMGATIAAKQRGMKVVALSIDPLGNLSSRVWAVNDQAPASVMSLAAENDEDLKRTSVVSSYLQTDKSGLRVLGSSTADGAAFLTPNGLKRALRVLTEQYDLSIIDFGLNIDSSVYHEGLSHVDQLALTASTTADSIDELHTLIATLKRFGGKYVELLQAVVVVVVVSQTRPGKRHINIDAERTRIANSYGLPVVTIPWYAHISEGGPMSIDLMDENTRLPYTWLAAEVMSKLPAD